MNRVLICEPDIALRSAYDAFFEKKSVWAVSVGEPAAAMDLLKKQSFHLCLCSIEDLAGAEVLYQLKNLRPATSVVVTSYNRDPALVVACMRAGAANFLVKDRTVSDSESLETLFQAIGEMINAVAPDSEGMEEIQEAFPHFVGRHPRMMEIFQTICSIKNSDSTILITGESGTGKEVVARSIHALSGRRRSKWVAVNCGAIPASLLESELFGHVKGAFTGAVQTRAGRFQLAGNGTLFLDEISDLSLDLQAKILRAIQNRVYEPVGSPHSLSLDARIIAATNQDLETAVAERRFREDLFYRLNVIPIYIPPLRTRKSDIPLLVKVFLERFSRDNGKEFVGISEEAMQCLMQYHWPGNVRELENLMERVVVLKRKRGIVELADFPPNHFRNIRLDRFVANVALPEDGLDFNQAVNEFENELILQALQKTEGNKNKAASLLNLNRTTLVEKLKRKGLRICS
jgi:DNA-binding NtrC family response regulator